MTRLSWTVSARQLLLQGYGCISSVYISFKCYSILHFAVCQLLCWAFLFYMATFTEQIRYFLSLLKTTSMSFEYVETNITTVKVGMLGPDHGLDPKRHANWNNSIPANGPNLGGMVPIMIDPPIPGVPLTVARRACPAIVKLSRFHISISICRVA